MGFEFSAFRMVERVSYLLLDALIASYVLAVFVSCAQVSFIIIGLAVLNAAFFTYVWLQYLKMLKVYFSDGDCDD